MKDTRRTSEGGCRQARSERRGDAAAKAKSKYAIKKNEQRNGNYGRPPVLSPAQHADKGVDARVTTERGTPVIVNRRTSSRSSRRRTTKATRSSGSSWSFSTCSRSARDSSSRSESAAR